MRLLHRTLFLVSAVPAALTLTAPHAAHAQAFTITFENATVPTHTGPNTTDAAATFSAAYGGTDTIQGVTFSDNFTVFRDTYTNQVGGNDLYGAPHGHLALTNIVNPPGAGTTAPDTGPGDAGPDALTFTTNAVLTSAYFGTVDYGNAKNGGSDGADQVTVTAFRASGDLSSVTLNLDTSGTPVLAKMDTSAFLAYAGQITGYRINRTPGAAGALNGGGNYEADDFTFVPAPEPGAPAGLTVGVALLGLRAVRRRVRPSVRPS